MDFTIRNGTDLDDGYLTEIVMNLNPNFDSIYVTGKELKNLNSQSHTILLNKPKNVVMTCSDKEKRTTFIDILLKQYKNVFSPGLTFDFLIRVDLFITNNLLRNLKKGEWPLKNNNEFKYIQ